MAAPDAGTLLARAEALIPALRERAREAEAHRRIPDETIADLVESGLIRATLPARLGGAEVDYRAMMEIVAALSRRLRLDGLGLLQPRELHLQARALAGAGAGGNLGRRQGRAAHRQPDLPLRQGDAGGGRLATQRALALRQRHRPRPRELLRRHGRGARNRRRFACSSCRRAITPWSIRGMPPACAAPAATTRWWTAPSFLITGPSTRRTRATARRRATPSTPARCTACRCSRCSFPGSARWCSGSPRRRWRATSRRRARESPAIPASGSPTTAPSTSRSPRPGPPSPRRGGSISGTATRRWRRPAPAPCRGARDRARYRAEGAYAARLCRQAVNTIMEASGGGGLYDSNPLSRAFRDIHAGSAHITQTWDPNAVTLRPPLARVGNGQPAALTRPRKRATVAVRRRRRHNGAMETARSEAAARAIRDAWRGRALIDAIPESCRPRTSAEGYAAQAALARLLGARPIGWKIAATSTAGQKHIGVDGPLAGRLLESKTHRSGAALPAGHLHMAVAEAEFAFRMGADLPGRGADYAVEEVMAAVSALHVAIEIPDSRFRDFTAVGAAQLIADNACTEHFVLRAGSAAGLARGRPRRPSGAPLDRRRDGGPGQRRQRAGRPAHRPGLARQRPRASRGRAGGGRDRHHRDVHHAGGDRARPAGGSGFRGVRARGGHACSLGARRAPSSQPNTRVAAAAPTSWARMKAGMCAGWIPENVSVSARATVTAGLAKEVDEVNQ